MMFRRLIGGAMALAVALSIASASQNTLQLPTSGTVSGLQFSNKVTDALDSLATCNSGSSAPTNASGGAPKAGQCWIDTTSSTLLKKYVYSGRDWVLVGVIDVSNATWSPPIGGGTATVASATTTSICGATVPQGYLTISGTTTITGFGTGCPAGQIKVVKFSGSLSLTHNATSQILPGSADITTSAGDTAVLVYEGSSNWRMALYSPATGQALANPAVPVGFMSHYIGASAPSKYVLGYGQAISRSTYANYLSVATVAQAGTRTSSSATVTGLTSTYGFGAGMPVEGTGIPNGTTISSVDSTTQITLSANATTSGTSTVTVFLYGYGSGGDTTTVGVPDCRGRALAGLDNMGGTAASRITSAGSSINGQALNVGGGAQTVTLSQGNLPNVNFTVTDPGHTHGISQLSGATWSQENNLTSGGGTGYFPRAVISGGANATNSSTTGITVASGGSGTAVNKMGPVLMANCIVRIQP